MSGRSSCPECGTILRIRDRTFVGRRVQCPECKVLLKVESELSSDTFEIRRLTSEEIRAIAAGNRQVKSTERGVRDLGKSRSSFFHRTLNSPLTVAWLLAIAVMIFVAVLTLSPKTRFGATRQMPVAGPSDQLIVSGSGQKPFDSEQTIATTVAPDETLPHSAKPAAIQQQLLPTEAISVSALEPSNVDKPLPVLEPNNMAVEPMVDAPPAPPKIDMKSKLEFKLVSYKQTKPISRRDLIESLQEQLGAPIVYDKQELGESTLEKMVTFELENPTIETVIKTIAQPAGWEIQIEPTGIRLTRKSVQ